MGGRKARHSAMQQFRQIDMRDWLVWMDAAYTLAVAAGREHRRHMTIISESLTWHALRERMLVAGLHELRDAPLFRAAKTLLPGGGIRGGAGR